MESKNKTELRDTENTLMVARSEGYRMDGMDEGGQKAQTSSYIYKLWGCNVQHSNYS